jgi:hypothetical protein
VGLRVAFKEAATATQDGRRRASQGLRPFIARTARHVKGTDASALEAGQPAEVRHDVDGIGANTSLVSLNSSRRRR